MRSATALLWFGSRPKMLGEVNGPSLPIVPTLSAIVDASAFALSSACPASSSAWRARASASASRRRSAVFAVRRNTA